MDSKTQNEIYDMFHALYKSEAILSEYYSLCAEKFEEKRNLFLGLSGDEIKHSKNLIRLGEILADNRDKVELGRYFSPEQTERFTEKVNSRIKMLLRNEMNLYDALKSSIEFENQIIETGYTDILKTESLEINYLLKMLDVETYNHRTRIQAAFDELSDSQKNLREDSFESEQSCNRPEIKMLRMVLESIADAVYYTDRDKRILWWNRAAEKLTGYTENEVTGKNCEQLLSHTDGAGNLLCKSGCPLELVKNSGESHFLEEVWLNTRDGKKKAVEVSCSAIKDNDGKIMGMVEVFRDRTRTKEMEKLKEEFFATVTHDLKSPLASIMGFAELIQNPQFGDISDKKMQFAESIKRSAIMLTNLINNIVDASRAESGQMNFNPKPVNLNLLLGDLKTNFTPASIDKQITLDFNIPGEMLIYADEEKIRRVLTNLISNSFRFTGKHGTIGIKARDEGKYIRMEVFDTGSGISEEDQKHIFDKYTQAKGESRGTGLGLFIVKNLLKLHGADVRIKSRPGQGTSFFFNLNKATDGISEDELKTAPVSKDTKKGKFLILSQNTEIIQLIRTLLEDEGHSVEISTWAMEALARAPVYKPDAVIISPPLPDLTTEEFQQSIKLDPNITHIPIAVITTEEGPGPENPLVTEITSPINPDKFREDINRILNR